jgi:hypothetical protein
LFCFVIIFRCPVNPASLILVSPISIGLQRPRACTCPIYM